MCAYKHIYTGWFAADRWLFAVRQIISHEWRNKRRQQKLVAVATDQKFYKNLPRATVAGTPVSRHQWGTKFSATLKPHRHHDTLVPRGLRGSSIRPPHAKGLYSLTDKRNNFSQFCAVAMVECGCSCSLWQMISYNQGTIYSGLSIAIREPWSLHNFRFIFCYEFRRWISVIRSVLFRVINFPRVILREIMMGNWSAKEKYT